MQLEITTNKYLDYASVSLLEDNYGGFFPCHLINSLMVLFTKQARGCNKFECTS